MRRREERREGMREEEKVEIRRRGKKSLRRGLS